MFGLVKKQKVLNALGPYLKALTTQAYSPQFNSGLVTYNYNNAGQHISAYATIDDLYSIIRKILKTCKRIPLYSYIETDQKAMSRYMIERRKIEQSRNYSTKAIRELKEYQTKAMELAGEQDEVQMLLDRPNDFETKDEFYEAAYGFLLLSGNDHIYAQITANGANRGRIYSMNNLAPNFMMPIISSELTNYRRRITGWKYTLYNDPFFIEANGEQEMVMHRKYWNPEFSYGGNELLGLSPLQAACRTLTQINNERDYANRSLINAGAEGLLTYQDEDGDLTPETLGQFKHDLLTELGSNWTGSGSYTGNISPTVDEALRNLDNVLGGGSNINAKKLGFAYGKGTYNYLRLTISPADMQLIEQGKITFKKLCNVYGISDILFNNSDASTESNVQEMVSQMYTNVVIPEVCSLRDSLSNGILYTTDGVGRKVSRYNDRFKRVIDFDLSDIAELQEDTTNIITRFANAPAFRVNDMFEALGFGRQDDPNAEVILVKQGYAPLADVTTPVNFDTTNLDNANANDYNQP